MSVPALRFPEFEGEWEENRLNSVVETVTSGSRDWAQYYSDTGAKFIRMTNIPRDGIRLLLSDLKYVALPASGSEGARTSLQGGDILVSITAELGKIGLVPGDLGEAYINQHTALVRPNKEKVVPDLLAQLLATKSSKKRLNRLNESGAKAGLNLGTVRSFRVCLPKHDEQKKIAGFLGVLDAKIAALRDRIAGLERYKRGLMQALFSQRLRFIKPDGTPFPDWEEKRLGEVFDITSSKRVFQDEWRDSGVPFFRAREVVKLAINGYVNNELFISEEMFAEYSKKFGAPEEGDILVTGVGTIGRVYLVRRGENFYFKDGNIVWLRSTKSISSEFVAHLFKSRLVQKQIITGAAITTVATYTIDSAKKTKIPVPHPDEQIKIAEALQAMDAKIAAVNGQLDRMQEFKKGLLQQMFV